MPDAAAADRGAVLLALARRSLEGSFGSGGGEGPSFPALHRWLSEPVATFVTLFCGDQLRGCVGSILPERCLAEDVWENARAAAFRDLRFPPLEAPELAALRIEISELSPLEELGCRSADDLEAALRPGVDGVLLRWQAHRGVFLPQVWEHLPQADLFLAELKRKAGLAPDFWACDVRLWRFTVTRWREPAAAAASEMTVWNPS